jgi:FkbM family methyltransferase
MKLLEIAGKTCQHYAALENAIVWLGHHQPNSRVTKSLCYHTGEAASLKNADDISRIAVLHNGAKIGVTLSEHSFRQIYFYGTYEPEVSALVCHLAKPKQVWLDVGANVGYFTILIASLIGPTGKVHTFEPNPDMMKQINHSVSLNGIEHVQKNEVAVSNISGAEAILYIPTSQSGQSGQSSLIVHRDIAEKRKVSVQTVSLDDYLAEIKKPADFMKIDVEGLEILVFQGMKQTLENQPPKVIICEVSDLPDCLASQSELIEHLVQYHYLPYIIKKEGLFLYKAGDVLAQEDYNFAFVQPSAMPLVEALIKSR